MSGPPPGFPRSTPAFGVTGRKTLCWGGVGGEEVLPGTGMWSRLTPGSLPSTSWPRSLEPNQEASHPRTFPLTVPSQEWVEGPTQSPSSFSGGSGRGGAGQLLRNPGAPSFLHPFFSACPICHLEQTRRFLSSYCLSTLSTCLCYVYVNLSSLSLQGCKLPAAAWGALQSLRVFPGPLHRACHY